MNNINIKFLKSIDNLKGQIKEMLVKHDGDFLPPLSSRKNISDWLSDLEKERFIVGLKGDKLIGFLSFIENYQWSIGKIFYPANYITTVLVSKAYRNRGIATRMYKEFLFNLPEEIKQPYAITRTWSTNTVHIHLLKKLGFEVIYKVENDRGKGVDTIYYGKKLE